MMMKKTMKPLVVILLMMIIVVVVVESGDSNDVYQPCKDTTIKRSDGFTFGIAFASRKSFFFNTTQQLSPCDSRLSLSSATSKLSIFRPKVDEISLLTINTTNFSPDSFGGNMVAFAGRKYAARSLPIFVANSTHVVTSFTLVLEFQKGTLQNLYWSKDGCSSCSGKSNFVCIDKQFCAIKATSCKTQGGTVDCSLGIQLAFSGTDKNYKVLNSWYEVKRLRQYSLYKLYSGLKNSLTDQYNKFF